MTANAKNFFEQPSTVGGNDNILNLGGTVKGSDGTQSVKINDPAGGATVDAEARTAIDAIIDALENVGITASV